MGYRVLIFSGAGLSAESGISTFRDSDGLWENHDVMEVCSADGFEKDRQKVLGFYDARRAELEEKKPNAAHEMIARIQTSYPDQIAVVTQNIDDLLERAGCLDVLHVHGTLRDARCEACLYLFPIGYESTEGKKCPKCGSERIRHNVVMFQEQAPKYVEMEKISKEVEMLVVIGTSGQVVNVAWMAQWVEHSILNNRDPDSYLDAWFKTVLHRNATEAASEIEILIRSFLKS